MNSLLGNSGLLINIIACFATSLLALVLIMPSYIKALKKKNINQVTSEYALNEYKNKEKTPIMELIF